MKSAVIHRSPSTWCSMGSARLELKCRWVQLCEESTHSFVNYSRIFCLWKTSMPSLEDVRCLWKPIIKARQMHACSNCPIKLVTVIAGSVFKRKRLPFAPSLASLQVFFFELSNLEILLSPREFLLGLSELTLILLVSGQSLFIQGERTFKACWFRSMQWTNGQSHSLLSICQISFRFLPTSNEEEHVSHQVEHTVHERRWCAF